MDLLWFVKHYNPNSSHHRAAFIELQRHIPKEQMARDADWVTIYNEASMELHESSFKQS